MASLIFGNLPIYPGPRRSELLSAPATFPYVESLAGANLGMVAGALAGFSITNGDTLFAIFYAAIGALAGSLIGALAGLISGGLHDLNNRTFLEASFRIGKLIG